VGESAIYAFPSRQVKKGKRRKRKRDRDVMLFFPFVPGEDQKEGGKKKGRNGKGESTQASSPPSSRMTEGKKGEEKGKGGRVQPGYANW